MLRQSHILGKGTRQITCVSSVEASPFLKSRKGIVLLVYKKWGHKIRMGNCLAKSATSKAICGNVGQDCGLMPPLNQLSQSLEISLPKHASEVILGCEALGTMQPGQQSLPVLELDQICMVNESEHTLLGLVKTNTFKCG